MTPARFTFLGTAGALASAVISHVVFAHRESPTLDSEPATPNCCVCPAAHARSCVSESTSSLTLITRIETQAGAGCRRVVYSAMPSPL